MICFNPFEFSFVFFNYIFGYDKENGFVFGKLSYFERMIAKEIANKIIKEKERGV